MERKRTSNEGHKLLLEKRGNKRNSSTIEKLLETRRHAGEAKTIEELVNKSQKESDNMDKKRLQELKDVDIAICLDYVEKIKKHLNRENETIQSDEIVESEDAVNIEEIYKKYGLEKDVLDNLEKLKNDANEGYLEKTYFLIVLNMILRSAATEESILTAARYLNKANINSKHYILDKETMSRLLKTDSTEEIENKIIEVEQDNNKSKARMRVEEGLKNTRVEIERSLEENGSFLADVYSNTAEKIGDYYFDEERNYCYKAGEWFINQWDEMEKIDM